MATSSMLGELLAFNKALCCRFYNAFNRIFDIQVEVLFFRKRKWLNKGGIRVCRQQFFGDYGFEKFCSSITVSLLKYGVICDTCRAVRRSYICWTTLYSLQSF